MRMEQTQHCHHDLSDCLILNEGENNAAVTNMSLVQLLDDVILPVYSHLPKLEANISTLNNQTVLVRNWWFYPHDDTETAVFRADEKNKECKCEAVITCNSLSLHLQRGLQFLEELKLSLLPTVSRKGFQNDASEYDKHLQELLDKIKELNRINELCLIDVSILEEIIKSLKSVQKSDKSDVFNHLDAHVHNFITCESGIVNSVSDNPCVPYVAEDEVFECTTDGGPSTEDQTAAPWWAELELEERAKKKMRAQGKRVLMELQPILCKKKEEFEAKEAIAKLRMQEKCLLSEDAADSNEVPSLLKVILLFNKSNLKLI